MPPNYVQRTTFNKNTGRAIQTVRQVGDDYDQSKYGVRQQDEDGHSYVENVHDPKWAQNAALGVVAPSLVMGGIQAMAGAAYGRAGQGFASGFLGNMFQSGTSLASDAMQYYNPDSATAAVGAGAIGTAGAAFGQAFNQNLGAGFNGALGAGLGATMQGAAQGAFGATPYASSMGAAMPDLFNAALGGSTGSLAAAASAIKRSPDLQRNAAAMVNLGNNEATDYAGGTWGNKYPKDPSLLTQETNAAMDKSGLGKQSGTFDTTNTQPGAGNWTDYSAHIGVPDVPRGADGKQALPGSLEDFQGAPPIAPPPPGAFNPDTNVFDESQQLAPVPSLWGEVKDQPGYDAYEAHRAIWNDPSKGYTATAPQSPPIPSTTTPNAPVGTPPASSQVPIPGQPQVQPQGTRSMDPLGISWFDDESAPSARPRVPTAPPQAQPQLVNPGLIPPANMLGDRSASMDVEDIRRFDDVNVPGTGSGSRIPPSPVTATSAQVPPASSRLEPPRTPAAAPASTPMGGATQDTLGAPRRVQQQGVVPIPGRHVVGTRYTAEDARAAIENIQSQLHQISSIPDAQLNETHRKRITNALKHRQTMVEEGRGRYQEHGALVRANEEERREKHGLMDEEFNGLGADVDRDAYHASLATYDRLHSRMRDNEEEESGRHRAVYGGVEPGDHEAPSIPDVDREGDPYKGEVGRISQAVANDRTRTAREKGDYLHYKAAKMRRDGGDVASRQAYEDTAHIFNPMLHDDDIVGAHPQIPMARPPQATGTQPAVVPQARPQVRYPDRQPVELKIDKGSPQYIRATQAAKDHRTILDLHNFIDNVTALERRPNISLTERKNLQIELAAAKEELGRRQDQLHRSGMLGFKVNPDLYRPQAEDTKEEIQDRRRLLHKHASAFYQEDFGPINQELENALNDPLRAYWEPGMDRGDRLGMPPEVLERVDPDNLPLQLRGRHSDTSALPRATGEPRIGKYTISRIEDASELGNPGSSMDKLYRRAFHLVAAGELGIDDLIAESKTPANPNDTNAHEFVRVVRHILNDYMNGLIPSTDFVGSVRDHPGVDHEEVKRIYADQIEEMLNRRDQMTFFRSHTSPAERIAKNLMFENNDLMRLAKQVKHELYSQSFLHGKSPDEIRESRGLNDVRETLTGYNGTDHLLRFIVKNLEELETRDPSPKNPIYSGVKRSDISYTMAHVQAHDMSDADLIAGRDNATYGKSVRQAYADELHHRDYFTEAGVRRRLERNRPPVLAQPSAAGRRMSTDISGSVSAPRQPLPNSQARIPVINDHRNFETILSGLRNRNTFSLAQQLNVMNELKTAGFGGFKPADNDRYEALLHAYNARPDKDQHPLRPQLTKAIPDDAVNRGEAPGYTGALPGTPAITPALQVAPHPSAVVPKQQPDFAGFDPKGYISDGRPGVLSQVEEDALTQYADANRGGMPLVRPNIDTLGMSKAALDRMVSMQTDTPKFANRARPAPPDMTGFDPLDAEATRAEQMNARFLAQHQQVLPDLAEPLLETLTTRALASRPKAERRQMGSDFKPGTISSLQRYQHMMKYMPDTSVNPAAVRPLRRTDGGRLLDTREPEDLGAALGSRIPVGKGQLFENYQALMGEYGARARDRRDDPQDTLLTAEEANQVPDRVIDDMQNVPPQYARPHPDLQAAVRGTEQAATERLKATRYPEAEHTKVEDPFEYNDDWLTELPREEQEEMGEKIIQATDLHEDELRRRIDEIKHDDPDAYDGDTDYKIYNRELDRRAALKGMDAPKTRSPWFGKIDDAEQFHEEHVRNLSKDERHEDDDQFERRQEAVHQMLGRFGGRNTSDLLRLKHGFEETPQFEDRDMMLGYELTRAINDELHRRALYGAGLDNKPYVTNTDDHPPLVGLEGEANLERHLEDHGYRGLVERNMVGGALHPAFWDRDENGFPIMPEENEGVNIPEPIKVKYNNLREGLESMGELGADVDKSLIKQIVDSDPLFGDDARRMPKRVRDEELAKFLERNTMDTHAAATLKSRAKELKTEGANEPYTFAFHTMPTEFYSDPEHAAEYRVWKTNFPDLMQRTRLPRFAVQQKDGQLVPSIRRDETHRDQEHTRRFIKIDFGNAMGKGSTHLGEQWLQVPPEFMSPRLTWDKVSQPGTPSYVHPLDRKGGRRDDTDYQTVDKEYEKIFSNIYDLMRTAVPQARELAAKLYDQLPFVHRGINLTGLAPAKVRQEIFRRDRNDLGRISSARNAEELDSYYKTALDRHFIGDEHKELVERYHRVMQAAIHHGIPIAPPSPNILGSLYAAEQAIEQHENSGTVVTGLLAKPIKMIHSTIGALVDYIARQHEGAQGTAIMAHNPLVDADPVPAQLGGAGVGVGLDDIE